MKTPVETTPKATSNLMSRADRFIAAIMCGAAGFFVGMVVGGISGYFFDWRMVPPALGLVLFFPTAIFGYFKTRTVIAWLEERS